MSDQKLDHLHVWFDDPPRKGGENMAVDEFLLQQVKDVPLLRFYQWARNEISFGYFESVNQARRQFKDDNLHFIRRWTGGGIVDHRADTTYTLVIPENHKWAKLRGSESYALIHSAVVRALCKSGVKAELIDTDSGVDSTVCFEKPVAYDVINEVGEKLAGSGQRRTRWGMLHQGSVLGIINDRTWSEYLAAELSDSFTSVDWIIEGGGDVDLVEKYDSEEWLNKR